MTPGFRFTCSNRLESLVAELTEEISESPLNSPFAPEIVVVPHPAVARWVNLEISQRTGIAANIKYPLPALWIWQMARRVIPDLPDRDPLAPETSAWKIFFRLPELLQDKQFAPIRKYLRNDPDAIKQWQISENIAHLFDRYQFYRPEMIRRWCEGQGAGWQPILWRELLQEHHGRHRIDVVDELLSILLGAESVQAFPERCNLFAISNLPPIFIELIHALAQLTRVNLYLLSPSEHYWADLSSKKTLSRMQVHAPEKAGYYENQNELLASWGKQGQALQDLLLNDDRLRPISTELFIAPGRETLLHRIQTSILHLESTDTPAAPDASVQIHICHSPLRECQILHDRLLAIFESDPSLGPEDILVMVPEIDVYAPYIEAVFARTENDDRIYIPWMLSDIAATDEHPLIDVYLQLLQLPESRFSATEILQFLDVPEVLHRFNLSHDDREIILQLLKMANLRWGIDAQHKSAFDLPEFEENTWRQAERRLFAGYAVADREFWNGIAPIDLMQGDRAATMGRFWQLLQTLIDYRKELRNARNAEQWQILLNQMLDCFFVDQSEESEATQKIRDVISTLPVSSGAETLSRELVVYWLEKSLRAQSNSTRYFAGGVSFCSMHSMHCIPFRVICLLGMNAHSFPRRESSNEFDLMQAKRKVGDPSRVFEDRYSMLETLLSARQILYVSYTGRELRDNSDRNPSALIEELIEFIDQMASDECCDHPKTSKGLTYLHSMQAFNPKNFSPNADGFDQYWAEIARSVSKREMQTTKQRWPTVKISLPNDHSRTIELNQLRRFLRHPIKYFFNNRLKIRLQNNISFEDTETFTPSPLERWQIKTMLTEKHLRKQTLGADQLNALGLLPHGSPGPELLDRLYTESIPMLDQIEQYAGTDPYSLNVELNLADEFSLVGTIENYYPEFGLLHSTPAKFKGYYLLALWLDHLCLCALDRADLNQKSRLVCLDQSRLFHPLPVEQATDALIKFLNLYEQGLQCPLAFFPMASFAWAEYCSKQKPEQALINANRTWDGGDSEPTSGEKNDPYIQIALRTTRDNPIGTPEFMQFSERFYRDALNAAKRS